MTRAARQPPMEIGYGDGVSFLSRPLGPAFDLRQIVLAPGTERACAEDEWADALVVVEHGTIEVTCVNGCRATFVSGDILCLGWLAPRVLRNRGRDVALLVAVARHPGSRTVERDDRMTPDA